MEGMRRKRSRSSIVGLTSLSALFALFVQLAPVIHALTPHEENSSSCTHTSKSLHLEAAAVENSPPCIVCAQLLGRQALLSPDWVQIDGDVKSLTIPPIFRVIPETILSTIPDPRGPPPAL